MAWARKLPSGRWQGMYQDESRKERSVGTFDRKADAVSTASEQERRIKLGEWVDPILGQQTFAEHAERYMSLLETDPATQSKSRSYLRTHLLPTFGDQPLASIKPKQVREWVFMLKTKPTARGSKTLSPATVAICYQLFARIMAQAVADELISKSPCIGGVTFTQKGTRPQKADRHLLAEQLERLADSIDPRFRAVILVMGYMGLRFGEVAGLTLDRRLDDDSTSAPLDLLRGTLRVTHSLQELSGHLRLKAPKTTKSERVLPLLPSIKAELERHLNDYPSAPVEVETDSGVRAVRFVFTGEQGGPLRKTWARRHFRPAAARAGLLVGPPALRPHHLRHTCASLLIDRGAHAKDVQEWLGHSSYQVTMDVYSHLFPERQHDLAASLEDLRRSATAR